ncbi:Minor histocompatibility antigen H13 [Conglomerata obtusa]
MNMYYLYEFTEYEIEERVLQETIISSEFSELLLESHVHQSHNHLNQSQLNNDQTQLNNNQSRIHSLNASQANNSQLHNQNRTHHSNHSRQYRHRLKRALKRLIRYLKRTIFEMRPVDAVIYFVGLTFVIAYYITRDWLIGDIITGSICFQSIRELKLDSIITGYIHLSILVCYDILMLIYHDYVDTLMHDITVPIRLVFPQNFKGYDLVGIGDIFIPALFLAIVKRYSDKYDVRAVFVYTYIGFCVGVFVAWLPVVILKHHMPVLLFLCPVLACFSLLAAYFCADFWHYIYFKRSSAK